MTAASLSNRSGQDLVHVYDRLAPIYDRLHRRWLKFAGGEAQAALEAAVRASFSPDARILDAGCGTGTFARALLAEGVGAENLTLLDPSLPMLERCQDLPCSRIHGRLEHLPFQDASFDIVNCAWVLETLPDPAKAIREMSRVVRPGGLLCLTFCAQKPLRGPLDWLISKRLTSRGAGRFLSVAAVAELVDREGSYRVSSVPLSGPVATLIARSTSTRAYPKPRQSAFGEPPAFV